VELAIFVGLQGSGKSTFYRRQLAGTHELVSKDLMRNVRDRNRRQLEQLGTALAGGRLVVVDNTNPAPADRAPLIAAARAHGARVVGYWFDIAVADCVRRNAGREGRARVPPAAIYATAKRLRPPALDEGFDALFRVTVQQERFCIEPWTA
jgi:predicted kinase